MFAIEGYTDITPLPRQTAGLLFSAIHEESARPVMIRQIDVGGISSSELNQIFLNYKKLKRTSAGWFNNLFEFKKDALVSDRKISFIYEDSDDQTLQTYQNGERLNIADFLHIAKELSQAIKVLHKLSIAVKALTPAMLIYDSTQRKIKMDIGCILVSNCLPITDLNPDALNTPSTDYTLLPYISPEQTGRLNCQVDYRSDFYCLGVIFYELLTGRLPFDALHPLDIIHCHLAQIPVPPSNIWVDIPKPISNLVMKLLAKNPDERYQSTYSLLADIDHCQRQFHKEGQIASFALGNEDVPEKIRLSRNLFGRKEEFAQLLTIFERIKKGSTEVVLVSGFPGIGKSKLIKEMNLPVNEAKGYLGIGKYDPLQKNIPFSAIIQALQDVIKQILTQSANRLAFWKERLAAALGDHGQVIVQVIPEIELIIGPQKAAPEMSPPDAHNRFHQIFQRFIQVFAQKEHPLVIFLDDIHWIDSASLQFIDLFFQTASIQHCLFIGAFRNNELPNNQNLNQVYVSIKRNNFPMTHIVLEGLEEKHVRQILIASLSKNIEAVFPLATIITKKTGGNPFFIGQFIQSLASQKLLYFDDDFGLWRWDDLAIQAAKITDNVLDIMLNEIRKLSKETQSMMKVAACIGNDFDFQILSAVCDLPLHETASLLLKSVNAGFIMARGESNRYLNEIMTSSQGTEGNAFLLEDRFKSPFIFMFLHDRVRQAVYSMVPNDQVKMIHSRIGKLMLKRMQSTTISYNIFNLVNQLNYGHDELTNPAERHELAELNLRAGRKAKTSTAYTLALSYLDTGIVLLADNSWKNQYALTLNLHQEKMECEYLNQHFENADRIFKNIIRHAESDIDKANAYNMKMIMFASQARHQEAVHIGLNGLRILNVSIREPKGSLSVIGPLFKAKSKLTPKEISKLRYLPRATDKKQQLIMKMLMNISFSAYLYNPYLIIMVALKIIEHTIKYGNSDASSSGYVIYGATLCAIFEKYNSGNTFGDLSLSIQSEFGRIETNPKIYLYYGMGICLWRNPIQKAMQILRKGLKDAMETGDRNYAVYHIQSILIYLIVQGIPLNQIYAECETHYDFIERTGDTAALNYLISLKQVIKCFKGQTNGPLSLNDTDFDEVTHVQRIQDERINIILLRHHLLKMRLLYIMGDLDEALRLATVCEKLLHYHIGTIIVADFYFFYCLILYARCDGVSKFRIKRLWQTKRFEKKIAKMAKACPVNFEHKHLLLLAERAKIENKYGLAAQLYQRAIYSAKSNGYLHMEAIANELAAKFFLDQGAKRVGLYFLEDAKAAYQSWGADSKVALLVNAFPMLTIRHNRPSSIQHTSSSIDYTALLTSLQTISTEIVLEDLLKKMMQIVIRNAGARKGFFLVMNDDQLEVKAIGLMGNPIRVTLQNNPIENRNDLLLSAVNYVKRTHKHLVLDEATSQGEFTSDPYVMSVNPKSVLCLPVLRQARLIAILYLENEITIGAFTPDRIETLQLIASQAAISFENARLYETMIQKESEHRQLSEKLRSLSSELLLTEERERRRIAIDLHDRIGHALTNVRMRLGMLQESKDHHQTTKLLQGIHELIDQSIQDTQSLTFDLSPPVLYDLGLEAAIEWLVYQMNEQHGIKISFQDHHCVEDLHESLRVLIFQATRELLFNVVKHAQAHHAWVSIDRKDDKIWINIKDDGIGFETATIGYSSKKGGGGFGLFSIQERLKYQGGDLNIMSKPGQGTNIQMTLPVTIKDKGSTA